MFSHAGWHWRVCCYHQVYWISLSLGISIIEITWECNQHFEAHISTAVDLKSANLSCCLRISGISVSRVSPQPSHIIIYQAHDSLIINDHMIPWAPYHSVTHWNDFLDQPLSSIGPSTAASASMFPLVPLPMLCYPRYFLWTQWQGEIVETEV